MAKRPPKQTYFQRSEDYAKQVSSEIIEQIKKGTAPWQKPWKPGEQHSPSNIETGKAYTGGNSLYLMSRQISEGRGDNRWGTYRQIEAAGGQVRRGEKGTKVLFYQNRTEQPAKDETGKIRKDKEGNTIYEETERSQAVMRQYTVFNVEQTDGLKLPPREAEATPEWDAHREADKVLRASGAKVQHVPGGDRAFYSPTEDKIVLPGPLAIRYAQWLLPDGATRGGPFDRPSRPDEPRHPQRRHGGGLWEPGVCPRGIAGGDQRHDDRRAGGVWDTTRNAARPTLRIGWRCWKKTRMRFAGRRVRRRR